MTALLDSPSPPATRRRRVMAPGLTIGALTLATAALRFRDPHEPGSWGFCPSAALGWYCPGCGGLRAVNDLTHGDVGAALSSNLLVTLLIPFAVLGLIFWLRNRWQGTVLQVNPRAVVLATVGFCAVAVAFSVVRNLGLGAWLAP